MRIAICEKDQEQAESLFEYTQSWARERNIHAKTIRFQSAEEFLTKWNSENTFDIIFISIEAGRMNGYELAKIIQRHDPNMEIIFMV